MLTNSSYLVKTLYKKSYKVIKIPEKNCYTCGRKNIVMETLALNTFRETLRTSLQKIADDHEPMVVKRQRGEDMVVLSLEDFNAMQETMYLFSHAANAAHLLQSKQQLAQGFSKQVPLSVLTA